MQTGALFFASASAQFIPSSLAGLRVWYNATNPLGTGALPTTGTVLSTWADTSGNAFNTSGGSLAVFTTNSINGLPAISFNGSNMYYVFPSAATIGLTNSDYTIFIVAQTSSSSTAFLMGGVPDENFEMHLNGGIGSRFIPKGGTYLDVGTDTEFTNGQPHLFQAMVNSTTPLASYTVDNVTPTTLASNCQSSATGGMFLGCRQGLILLYSGFIGEVAIYNRALSSTELTQIRNYFATKWGVTV